MKKPLLNNPHIAKYFQDKPIVVLDGGARGQLFSPFNLLNHDIVKVLKFEADPDASIKKMGNEIVVPKALFNKKGNIDLYVAISPTASSVFPFNEKLQEYIDPYKDVRKLSEKVNVECISLDEFCEEENIAAVDFIKLDIHGCEYEVLEGAANQLPSTIGLLVENWILPIHKGQHTRGHIESYLYDRGFYVVEEYVQSAWKRVSKYHKRQAVTVDTLYFKDPIIDENVKDTHAALKLIGIAELFDHYGFALQLANYFAEKGIINKQILQLIEVHFKKYNESSFISKIRDKIFTYLKELTSEQSFK